MVIAPLEIMWFLQNLGKWQTDTVRPRENKRGYTHEMIRTFDFLIPHRPNMMVLTIFLQPSGHHSFAPPVAPR